MNEQIRVGLIGTGGYAELMHIQSIQSHPGARLVAICGRDRVRAAAMASKYRIDEVFTDYREMISCAGLDAMVIASPDRLHYSMALEALEAKLHIVCEKPLTDTPEQAYELYQKALAAGVVHMVPFTWSWMPMNQRVNQLVQQGYIGKLYHAEIRLIANFGLDHNYRWQFDPQYSDGVISDSGVHAFHPSRLFCGEASQVFACLSANVWHYGQDLEPMDMQNDSATILIDYASGAKGTIQLSKVAGADNGVENTVLLYGSDGTIEMKMSGGQESLRGKQTSEKELHPLEVPEEFYGPMTRGANLWEYFWKLSQEKSVGDRAFIDAIINQCSPKPDFYDGWKAQQIVAAAIQSDKSRSWVKVD